MSRSTVEQVADRVQRRSTGPWKTVAGSVVTVRYRRRRRIEYIRLDVALHRIWKPVVMALSRVLVRLHRAGPR